MDLIFAILFSVSVGIIAVSVCVIMGVIFVKISRNIQLRRIRTAGGNIYVASRIKE